MIALWKIKRNYAKQPKGFICVLGQNKRVFKGVHFYIYYIFYQAHHDHSKKNEKLFDHHHYHTALECDGPRTCLDVSSLGWSYFPIIIILSIQVSTHFIHPTPERETNGSNQLD